MAPDLSALESRFARLTGEYEHRRATAHGQVIRWVWHSWPGPDLRPLHHERHLLRPGHPLADRPPLDQTCLRIGFDARDRPVAIEEHSGFLGGTLYYETFRDHGRSPVEEAHYRSGGEPIYLHEHCFDGGLLRETSAVATGGNGHETFEYAEGRPILVTEYHGKRGEPLRLHEQLTAASDTDGLVRLESRAGLIYERPPPWFSLESAIEVVRAALLAAIPPAIAELDARRPAYCVALAYDEAYPGDCMIHIGLDERRRAWLAGPDDARDLIWNPAEFDDAETPVDLEAIAGTVRLLRQELRLAGENGDRRGRELLCGVAAELNHHDWTGILTTTDDFVVYAVDLELGDLEANLAACIPPARLTQLRNRGLLPSASGTVAGWGRC